MAINYNINPYSAGAIVIDQRPLMQMFQQQMLHRQAREESLDNYFRDLSKNITPAGMRNQDVPSLTKKTNDWQQFYQQNKSAILNPRLDNGKSYSEYMGRYQDMLGHIQQSKDALKTTDELNKVRLNPQSSYILDDPTIIDQIHQHDLPIGDPNRKELNIASLVVPPKPWDVKDLEAHSKYLTSGLTPDKVPGATQFLPGFKTQTPITSQYSDNNLKAIGARSGMAYDMDRSLQFETNKLMRQVQNDPIRQQQLNSQFNRLYGKNIETPRELRMAQDILNENKKSIEYKPGEDTYGREVAMENLRHKNAKELLDYKKQIDPNDTRLNNMWVDQYLNNLTEEARKRQAVEYKYKDDRVVKEHSIPVDPVLGKALSIGGINPDDIRVDDNDKFRAIFYQRYEKGEQIPEGKKVGDIKEGPGGKISVDETVSRPKFSRQQVELALGKKVLTPKALGKQMGKSLGVQQTSAKYPLPAGKPKTVKQNGFTYTYNEQTGQYE